MSVDCPQDYPLSAAPADLQDTRRRHSITATDTTNDTTEGFVELGVDEPTRASLASAGITSPFPIQSLCLPLGLAGVDLIGRARTGTGKTLAFGIPLVQRVDIARKEVQALVVVPTRELCIQVAGEVESAGRQAGVHVISIVGGRPIGPQIDELKAGAQIVVGTPGRLLDHMRQRTLKLDTVRMVVLDEADEMLDLGFLPDVETILRATPDSRQTMLLSATMPKEVIGLARRYMRQPTFVHAESDEQQTVPETKQHFFQVHPLNRFEVLTRILDTPNRERVAVFRRTKRGVERTILGLKEQGYNAGALHGDMPQQVRERVMGQFRAGKIDVMVCTDVAARGLDVAGLSHVVNYDTPEDDKAYVHRIGRTGRAGAAGVAITFIAWNERSTAELIQERLNLKDEPIHEIYSTSDLLVELFDLPSQRTAAAARRPQAPAPKAPVPKASVPGSSAPRDEKDEQPRQKKKNVRRRRRGVQPNTEGQAVGTNQPS